MSRSFRHALGLVTAAVLAVGTAVFVISDAPEAVAAPGTTLSSAGQEFWLAFDSNASSSRDEYLKLYVSGEPGTTGQADIAGLSFMVAFTIPADGVAVVDIPIAARLNLPINPVELAVHVTADANVTVYGLNRTRASTDAFLGLPVSALGTRYRTMDYNVLSSDQPATISAIATTAGTTTIHVEPPASSGLPPFDMPIQLGEVFEWNATTHLTGTLVTSDKPISVFSGNRCANIPSGIGYCDHIVEQMIPTNTWGKTFITYPLHGRTADTFRILADLDGTEVTIKRTGSDSTVSLAAGEFYEFLSGEPMAITATQPISVAQYSNGQDFDGVPSDPFMALIPSYEQGFTNSTFATPTAGFTSYVNITASTTDLASITLDGAAIPTASWQAIPGSAYSGVAIAIGPGAHTISSTTPLQTLVYGFADHDSYGYPGGLRTARIAEATTLTVAPPSVTGNVGDSLCTIVSLLDKNGVGIAGARIDMTLVGVVSTPDSIITGADGTIEFCAVSGAEGVTDFTAAQGTLSATGTFTWLPPHLVGTLVTTRTITYTGAGDLTPGDVVQTLTWATDTDPVTGIVIYTPTDSYPAVSTPTIDGYQPDRSIVNAVSLGVTTTMPLNLTETVTYSTVKIEVQTGGTVMVSERIPTGSAAAVLLFLVAGVVLAATRSQRTPS